MSKFNYKKIGIKSNGIFLRIASERVVFKAVGEPHKTKGGYIAIPIKIYAGVFKDFNGKKYTEGKGTLLLPGMVEQDKDFMKALEDGEIIGIVSEKKNEEKYYLSMYTIIENPDDIEDFVNDEGGEDNDE